MRLELLAEGTIRRSGTMAAAPPQSAPPHPAIGTRWVWLFPVHAACLVQIARSRLNRAKVAVRTSPGRPPPSGQVAGLL